MRRGYSLVGACVIVVASLATFGTPSKVAASILPSASVGIVSGVGGYFLGNGGDSSSTSLIPVCAPGETAPCTSPLSGVVQLGSDQFEQEDALTSAGTVYTWGVNDYGGLGDGDTNTSDIAEIPVEVCAPGSTSYPCTSPLTDVTAIAEAGDYGTGAALTTSGNVYTWGEDQSGDLGNDTENSNPNPVPSEVCAIGDTADPCTSFLAGITQIAAACDTFYGLTTAGDVVSWGQGAGGELGNGTFTAIQTVPVAVTMPGGVTFTSIAAENDNCSDPGAGAGMGLSTTGHVYAWGSAKDGDLGNGNETNQDEPVEVEGVGGSGYLSSVTAIGGGSYMGYAVSGGNVYSWGSSNDGNQYTDTSGIDTLGNNDPALTDSGSQMSGTPVEVCAPGQTAYPCTGFLSGITEVVGDAYTGDTYAINGSGNVFAWGGSDFDGQLGDGPSGTGYAAGYSNVPLEMVNPNGGFLENVTQIGTGSSTNDSSIAGQVFIVATQHDTAVTISADPPEISTGEATTLTADVSASGVTPTGAVTFMNGATPLGTGTLDDGVATLSVPGGTFTSNGTYDLTAVYGGDYQDLPSTSSEVPFQVGYGDTIKIVVSPDTVTQGEKVTLTGTVTALDPADGTPAGTVTFTANGTPIPGCENLALVAGTASCQATNFPVGSDSIAVAYTTTNEFLEATVAVTLTVAAAPAVPDTGAPVFALPLLLIILGGAILLAMWGPDKRRYFTRS